MSLIAYNLLIINWFRESERDSKPRRKPSRSESRRSQPRKADFLEEKSQYDRLKHEKIVERCRSLSDLGFKQSATERTKYSKLEDLDLNCTSDSSVSLLREKARTHQLRRSTPCPTWTLATRWASSTSRGKKLLSGENVFHEQLRSLFSQNWLNIQFGQLSKTTFLEGKKDIQFPSENDDFPNCIFLFCNKLVARFLNKL